MGKSKNDRRVSDPHKKMQNGASACNYVKYATLQAGI